VSPHRIRPAYDRWRDVDGTPIPEGCQVEQVLIDRSQGALRSRLGKQGTVVRRGRDSRLHVLFDGEQDTVSIRPHLVQVRPAGAGTPPPNVEHIISQLEQLRETLPTPAEDGHG